MALKQTIQKIGKFIQQENIHKLLLVIVVIVLFSAVAISWFEPDISFVSGMWWSIVTLTTVGYGDISPSTAGGRLIAVLIMFFGIGLLGTLSASLAAIIISNRMKENKGMSSSQFAEHIIICEWNHRAKAILKELRTDKKTKDEPIVLIADLEEKPVDDQKLLFIKGDVCDETLERANLAKAKTVIVLGNDHFDASTRDARVVLTTLAIESLRQDVYTVVELVDEENVRHCKRANADEIIVGNELSSHLIASAAIDHGISNIVSELLSTQHGNELFGVAVKEAMVGKSFMDVFIAMKKEKQSTVLGVQKGRGGELLTNPPADYIITADDYLIVVSKDRHLSQENV